ncbi:RNA-binding domain-containing protein [Rhodofomes roseus]|uniref:Probable RNA-binding protein 18 n=1 Tax=Rhodofomes roseus TaxID=34475 RepID=A0ABQ8K4X1_9APHY|nr:RNA-binding domain-containing protein [Rhodofomes roseus]KAH9832015.1 RNA-binding domain-containing protein [Rhodofomes roseus]
MSPAQATPSPTPSSSSVTPEKTELASHLSYPAPELPVASTSASHEERPRPVLKERLYVGNLHPTVDEYTLLQVFTKFGKVSKLDFLFHKTGPLKGKPRGYAFIEFADANEAEKALERANDKLLRGRKLVITHAHQAPLDQGGHSGARPRRTMNDAGKPTTLSMLKGASTGRANMTEAKIARMEAKLRELEQSAAESPASKSKLPVHPSLPPKPVAASAAAARPPSPSRRQSVLPRKPQHHLPSLPMAKPTPSPTTFSSGTSIGRHMDLPKKNTPLAGVRIVKKKDK